MDSGYNTAGTASLIDGFSSDYHNKESFSSNLVDDTAQVTRHTKAKVPRILSAQTHWSSWLNSDFTILKVISCFAGILSSQSSHLSDASKGTALPIEAE